MQTGRNVVVYVVHLVVLWTSGTVHSQTPILPNATSWRAEASAEARLIPLSLATGTPTKDKIERFLSGGVAWGSGSYGEQRVVVTSDGRVSITIGTLDARGMRTCRCGPVEYRVGRADIEFSCLNQCGTEDPFVPSPPKNLSSEWRRFRWSVLYVSATDFLFRDPDGRRYLVTHCVESNQVAGVGRNCANNTMTIAAFLIEFVGASDDASLYEAVRKRLEDAPTRLLRRTGILVEGPAAKTPRRESEVFFAVPPGASRDDAHDVREVADDVARCLRNIIGPVEVKEWPGKWDYDVVVVVGAVPRVATPDSDQNP